MSNACAVGLTALLFGVTGAARAQDLAAAESALRTGLYEDAERALSGAGTGALCPGASCEAELLLARLRLERAQYAEAARIAGLVAARPAVPAETVALAQTLMGEAEAARGELDAAEAALRLGAAEEAGHRARVLLARLLIRRGREGDAQPLLQALIRAYNDETIARGDAAGLAYVAMAAAMLGSAHDANDAFAESTRADRTRVETQIEWAWLYLDHHDVAHAEACVRDALRANPNHPLALALSARVLLAQSMDFAGADALLDRALSVAPDLVPAHVTRAAMALRDQDLVSADDHLDRALAIDGTAHEALSVRAAVRFVASDRAGFERAIDAVHALQPRDVRVFSVVSEHADWEHRYVEQVALARRALAIAPDDARSLATLGTNLLRTGEEAEGLVALNRAFVRDRFDVRVFNTLNFFEDVVAPHYVWLDGAPRPFRIRAHRDEERPLAVLLPPLVEEAYRALSRRYGTRPRAIDLEMYTSSQHFALRTTGLPNLGVQGVCFGRVVTAISPAGGPFDTAQVVWHELSHVYHLALSRNRVPRWLTEGLAEYETSIARPAWAREEDARLYLMLTSGRLPPLARMNHAFTHARSPLAVMDAYYASTRIAAFLVDRYGMRRVVALLREYGRGRTDEQAFQRALRVSVDEVGRLFVAAELARLSARATDFAVDLLAFTDLGQFSAAALAAPADARAQAEHGASLLVNGRADEAVAVCRRAVSLDPHEPTARFVLLEAAVARRDRADAIAHVTDLITSGHDGYAVRIAEARAALMGGDRATARASLFRASEIDPSRVEAWVGLATIAEQSADALLRRTALEHIVALDQHDRPSVEALTRLLEEAGEPAGIVALAERARFVDPENRALQLRVARAFLLSGDPEGALAPLALALATDAPDAHAHVAHAEALSRLGRRRAARAAADAALAIDPSLAAEVERVLASD